MSNHSDVLAAAFAWHDAGVAVLPAAVDGTKRPGLTEWKAYQDERPSREVVAQWFGGGRPGLGVICGAVSGGLEMLEMEGRAVAAGMLGAVSELIDAAGLADVWVRVTAEGYAEQTPSGGLHLLYRIADAAVPGNTKLARNAGGEVLAETRGEGGWVVVAPSGGPTHETGRPWTVAYGSPATVPTITMAERDALHSAFRCLDQTPPAEPTPTQPRLSVVRTDGSVAPGDDYEARTSWSDILRPHGWTLVFNRGQVSYWRRPGKDRGVSATTGHAADRDRLYVFSSSTEFEQEHPYTKFGAYVLLEHDGDYTAAARALRAAGYGTPTPLAGQVQAEAIADLIPPRERPATDGSVALAQTSPVAVDLEAEFVARRALRLQLEVAEVRLKREARRIVDAEEHAEHWREPIFRDTLAEELAIPDEPVIYRVTDLLPAGGNVLMAAQYKAGKTTLAANLVRSLVDDEPFLGRFPIGNFDGRVAIFNYEVDERQFRRWMRDLNIVNQDRVTVLNLRGYRLPPIHPHTEEWIVKWLVDHEVAVWLVDPFARAFVGCGEENSNSDVGVFLDALDVIKEQAGVGELILPTHTGRGEQAIGLERARGATRLDDWADVRWLLTTDDQQRRFFRATGRDVEAEEEMLGFDPSTRRLSLGGWDRQGMRQRDLTNELVAYVRDNPGLGTNEIIEGLNKNRTKVSKALQEAIREGRILTKEIENRKRLHYPGLGVASGLIGDSS